MRATTTPDRKQAIRTSELDAWNEGNVDVFDELYTDEYVLHTPMGDRSMSEVKAMIESIRSGTSDFEFEIEDLFGEDDRVGLRYTMSGTNTGPSFLTDEPTDEYWEGSGISMYRFEGGRVAEQWDNFDYLGVMQQLGLVPSEPARSTP